MKLTPIAKNQNIVTYSDGTEVFFSYETPVAGFHEALGYVKTANWYSSTTTRHINKYLGVIKADEVPQEIINSLANGCYKSTDYGSYTKEQQDDTTCEELSNSDNYMKDEISNYGYTASDLVNA